MAGRLTEKFLANTFVAEKLDEVPLREIGEAVERDSFARIRGLISRNEIMAGREVLAKDFSAERDIPATGQDPAEVRSNWQKLVIGGVNTTGVYRPRCFRTLFNPLLAEDRYGLHDVFRTMVGLRNRLQDLPDDYACDRIEDGLWTASRIHQYPRGAGFMGPHRDSVVDRLAKDAGRSQFHQVVLLMSERGEDFETGGGFVEIDGERLVFEEFCEVGDVVVYDGLATHGVADIDPHLRPDLASFSGRLAAFVTLYKDLGQR